MDSFCEPESSLLFSKWHVPLDYVSNQWVVTFRPVSEGIHMRIIRDISDYAWPSREEPRQSPPASWSGDSSCFEPVSERFGQNPTFFCQDLKFLDVFLWVRLAPFKLGIYLSVIVLPECFLDEGSTVPSIDDTCHNEKTHSENCMICLGWELGEASESCGFSKGTGWLVRRIPNHCPLPQVRTWENHVFHGKANIVARSMRFFLRRICMDL